MIIVDAATEGGISSGSSSDVLRRRLGIPGKKPRRKTKARAKRRTA